MNENEKLARDLRNWRAIEGFTAEDAARVLGIPKRTYEGVEQGRGFPYPQLLRIALETRTSSPQVSPKK
ncbi:MAG: XRE family transcriptional regulator [Mesorhizobium sp.]|uniref:helix-turn-helix domain-containing protein n=1 Tax=Mesorhizobium sp. TaxID=1871066 RepID=UPI000FE51A9F|nr:MAG: XRE family transcriptional regulator [Mesorhizobium sp.]